MTSEERDEMDPVDYILSQPSWEECRKLDPMFRAPLRSRVFYWFFPSRRPLAKWVAPAKIKRGRWPWS